MENMYIHVDAEADAMATEKKDAADVADMTMKADAKAAIADTKADADAIKMT